MNRAPSRLRRLLHPNTVRVGSLGADQATLSDLRKSCPMLTDGERRRLLAGNGLSRYFRTTQAATRFYASIHGDDPPGMGGDARWFAGHSRKWVPVYASLTLGGRALTENS